MIFIQENFEFLMNLISMLLLYITAILEAMALIGESLEKPLVSKI